MKTINLNSNNFLCLCLAIFTMLFFAHSAIGQKGKIKVQIGSIPSLGNPDGTYSHYDLLPNDPNLNAFDQTCGCWSRDGGGYSFARMSDGSWYIFKSERCATVAQPSGNRYAAGLLKSSSTSGDPTEINGVCWLDDLPESLAIYYAWPSIINGSSDAGDAADVFDDYNIVVFPEDVETTSTDLESDIRKRHDGAQSVINELNANNSQTIIYGYIPLGNRNNNIDKRYTPDEIRTKITGWKAMGVDGIFLDEGGNEFNVNRTRQNQAIDAVHNEGMTVMLNAWNPGHVFTGTPAINLNANDYYLLESFTIKNGVSFGQRDSCGLENSFAEFTTRVEAVLNQNTDVKIATVTTYSNAEGYTSCGGHSTYNSAWWTSVDNNTVRNAKFRDAWWRTVLYKFDVMGWGEDNFSATNNFLPFFNRPGTKCGSHN